jgi:xanthine phosphoribosyltransferase
MNCLEEKILKDGLVKEGNVLKVDSFLNHQIDTALVAKCAVEWYEVFKNEGVTKILTIDGTGIGIACIAALNFNVPVVFAKKSSSANKVGNDFYSTKVVSFTHGHEYNVMVKKDLLTADDKVLIIDDFLANATAMKALISLTKLAGATVVGCGAAIEKVYQGGGNDIRNLGYKVESLARISSMRDDGKIEFC